MNCLHIVNKFNFFSSANKATKLVEKCIRTFLCLSAAVLHALSVKTCACAFRNDYIISVLPFVRRTAIAQSSSWNQRETRLEWRSIYNCFSLSWYPVARPSEWFEDLLHMSYIDYCIPRDLWTALYPKTNGNRKAGSCSIRHQCRTAEIRTTKTFLMRNQTNPSYVRNTNIYTHNNGFVK